MATCDLLGVDRQVYYRAKNSLLHKQSIAQKVINLVRSIRNIMPKLGTRKLYHILEKELKLLKVGRDKLFKILKANHMLITPKKSYHITTDSHHRFRKHKNIVSNVEILRPEQIWVSDITYIGNRNNPCYLVLIADAYSKKIMGYNVSDSLNMNGTIQALDMALKNRTYKELPLIHHSDRGLQYCSYEYQNMLKLNKIKTSMTEKYDPYENAIAERINGILKQEFDIAKHNSSFKVKQQLVKNAVQIYNLIRPHLSNNMLTPAQMHKQSTLKRKQYKSKNLKGASILKI